MRMMPRMTMRGSIPPHPDDLRAMPPRRARELHQHPADRRQAQHGLHGGLERLGDLRVDGVRRLLELPVAHANASWSEASRAVCAPARRTTITTRGDSAGLT